MRFRISGPFEVLDAMHQAGRQGFDAQVEAPPKRRESAELRLGFHDIADIVSVAKDAAELAPLILAGIAWLHSRLDKTPSVAPALEIETASGTRVRVALQADVTLERVQAQLAPLRPMPKP